MLKILDFMKKILLILGISSILLACNKESTNTKGEEKALTFEVNGEKVATDVWNLSYQNMILGALTLMSRAIFTKIKER